MEAKKHQVLRHARVAASEGGLQRVHIALAVAQLLGDPYPIRVRQDTQQLSQFLGHENTMRHEVYPLKIQTFEPIKPMIIEELNG